MRSYDCLATGVDPFREGEAPAEPNACQSAGSSGSAGVSPSQGLPARLWMTLYVVSFVVKILLYIARFILR
ncbi:MAG: hypothetical protein ACOVRM_07510 [Planctomycetaceae bacterium]